MKATKEKTKKQIQSQFFIGKKKCEDFCVVCVSAQANFAYTNVVPYFGWEQSDRHFQGEPWKSAIAKLLRFRFLLYFFDGHISLDACDKQKTQWVRKFICAGGYSSGRMRQEKNEIELKKIYDFRCWWAMVFLICGFWQAVRHVWHIRNLFCCCL